jgi:hypothetical protein
MSIEFIATECGFHDGLGGASNAAADEDYHYILFGRQIDSQHPQNSDRRSAGRAWCWT